MVRPMTVRNKFPNVIQLSGFIPASSCYSLLKKCGPVLKIWKEEQQHFPQHYQNQQDDPKFGRNLQGPAIDTGVWMDTGDFS